MTNNDGAALIEKYWHVEPERLDSERDLLDLPPAVLAGVAISERQLVDASSDDRRTELVMAAWAMDNMVMISLRGSAHDGISASKSVLYLV